jgi:hypothetical protein
MAARRRIRNDLTPEIIIDALRKARGWVSEASNIAGCSYSTFYNYRDKYPEVAEAWQQIYDERHDYVEAKAMDLIDQGNVPTTIFYLKTQAKHRGWQENMAIDGDFGGKIEFVWVTADDADAAGDEPDSAE